MRVSQGIDPVIGTPEELESHRPISTSELEACSIEHHQRPGRQFEATDPFKPIEITSGTQQVAFPVPFTVPPSDPDLLGRLATQQLVGEAGAKSPFV
jgi:hypothetical protein